MVSYLYEWEYLMQFIDGFAILPFLLIFTIIFAVLQKIKILGEGKKKFNVIIALVIALSVIIPHLTGSYPYGYDVVDLINIIIPQISLVAVTFVMLLLLTGIFAPRWVSKSIAGILAMISFVAVLVIFGGALEWWESGWLYGYFGEETISLVLIILVFGIIIWFITREPTDPASAITRKAKELFEWFGGG
jgi:hypothetical protein